jgi:NADH-quinone oxidoreductase subunit D
MDIDDRFVRETLEFIPHMRKQLVEYQRLVGDNVIFRNRTEGVGVITEAIARDYAVTGPCLRAVGVPYDVRRAEPYSLYERFDFEIPTATEGDCFARYRVRLAEIEQSLRIVEQALPMLEPGDFMAKKAPRRIKPPVGETYYAVESARGHFGTYVLSDGGLIPAKLKLRTPSFSNLSCMPDVLADTPVADTIAIVGSIDVVMPEIDR